MKKKLMTVALLVLCAIMVFAACTDKNKGDKDGDKSTILESYKPLMDGDTPLIVIVRHDESSAAEKDAAVSIKEQLSQKLGKNVQITVDWNFDKTKYPSDAFVVSVGNTTIPEAQDFISAQSGECCGIKIVDKTIVLATTNDMYLSILVDTFMSAVVEAEGAFWLDTAKVEYDSGEITTATVISGKTSQYSIVYRSTKGESDYPDEIAKDLSEALEEKFGVKLAVKGDNVAAGGKEIILDNCQRREVTAGIVQDLLYNEYVINVEADGTIVICGKNQETTLRGVEEFLEMAEMQKKSGEFKIASILSGKRTVEGLPSVPLYEDSKDFELISSVLNSSAMYYDEVSVDGYNSYLTQLEKAGYEFVVKNEIKGNIFATYQNDEAVINCYYTAYDSSMRVCVDSKMYTEIHNFEPQSTKAITTPMLIQYTSGCGYLLRLEDGTFVIYDSGMSNSEVYKNLNECIQKYNVTGSKPIVRAWMYSHPHVDHVGGFFKFCESYAGSIYVQQFVFNNPTRTHYQYTIDDPPDGDVILEDRIFKFLDYCEKYYPKADIVVGHTGQIMYFGNTKAEILHTHEDDYPTTLKAGNQISMLVRFTFGNQTILFTGDMHQTSNPLIIKMFGDHMKSDMVQMAHHGYNGGSADFYKAVDADVCLFTNKYESYLTLMNKPENMIGIKLASQVLVPVDEHDIIAFDLPYKSSYGEKWNRK